MQISEAELVPGVPTHNIVTRPLAVDNIGGLPKKGLGQLLALRLAPLPLSARP